MEMKAGYKQTEAGAIPEDWFEYTIGDLIQFQGGSQPDKSTFQYSPKSGYIRLIQIRDYKADKYETYVPIHFARRFCDQEDIMIGRYGPPIFQILKGISGAYNVALIKAIPDKKLNKSLAYFYLKQEKLLFFIEKLSQRSSGQTGVDLKELREFPLPLPPTEEEQTAIANALSDADALIQSLQKLIAKKRQIKQGAMQTLLTGRKRLPGFQNQKGFKQTEVGEIPNDWELSTLTGISIVPMQNGVFYEPSLKGVGVKLINVGDLYSHFPINTESLELFNATEEECSRFKVENGDLFFTRSSIVPSGIAFCNMYSATNQESVVFDSHVIRMRPDSRKVVSSFLYRFCIASAARRYLVANAKTATMTTIDQGSLRKCPVVLPSIAEQNAIATTLSDMDADIAALETKLAKYQQIKQGMMQNLLTGKIRLV